MVFRVAAFGAPKNKRRDTVASFRRRDETPNVSGSVVSTGPSLRTGDQIAIGNLRQRLISGSLI